ncbi:MAG: EthD domain-containing protein [Proteobacteria bacterium]|nr:EthD domain-containing protein [Pseudomonadota bacterium]
MLKICFCMRRLPQLSREEFQTYYRRDHTRVLNPEEVEALGMRRYVQLHALSAEQCARLDMGRGGEPEFDAVAEIWLDDEESFERNWLGEAGQAALRRLMEDEQKFVDWSRSVIFMSRELVFMDGPSTPARPPKSAGGD